MELAVTFGAVGDLLAVAALIKDIITALDDCRGSSKAYRDLVQSMEALAQALQEVDRIYHASNTSFEPDEQTRSAVLHIVGQVRQCLDGFKTRIAKFAPGLAQGGSGNTIKDAARKIQWKLEEKDIEKFKTEVAAHTEFLKFFLNMTTM